MGRTLQVPMLPLALRGFREAHARHDDLRLSADPESLYVSAAECVYWAATIDEQIRGRRGYANFQANHLGGQLLPGVRYVRNVKTHGLPMTMQKIVGKVYPITFPLPGFEVVWLPLDALPAPRDKTNKYTQAQADSYGQHLAGQPTRHTFRLLADGFDYLATIDGSPLSEERDAQVKN
jgi:hypothetical protein